jgi:hypothetical protein
LVEEPTEIDDEFADLFLSLGAASSLPLEAPKLLDRAPPLELEIVPLFALPLHVDLLPLSVLLVLNDTPLLDFKSCCN